MIIFTKKQLEEKGWKFYKKRILIGAKQNIAERGTINISGFYSEQILLEKISIFIQKSIIYPSRTTEENCLYENEAKCKCGNNSFRVYATSFSSDDNLYYCSVCNNEYDSYEENS